LGFWENSLIFWKIQTCRNFSQTRFLGDKIDFLNEPQYKTNRQKAVIDASVLLKTFFRSMGEPLITNRLYPELIKLSGKLSSRFSC
jgi:hypothetical protein